MSFWPVLLVAATLFVAYANGANDNFKGVATLFGSGTAVYRKALWWATATTLAGSISAAFLATALIPVFQGKGLVPASLAGSEPFLTAVISSAALTVFTATQIGIPVSRTHVSCGALFGIGAVNGQARWDVIRSILLAWVLTVPLAALLAGGILTLLRQFGSL